ncbi:MAG: hypothetical protein JXA89_04955, partial [Anaerolineae bacterium]|nr:hypothetical protein [Anaerolineae bacterium]
QTLLDVVALQRGGSPDLAPIMPFLSQSHECAQGAMGTLLSAIEAMWATWRVKETRPSRSGAAFARTVWRLLIVGAYRVLLGRQFKFNYLAIRAVGALAAHTWDDETTIALLTERYGILARRVAQLEARLARIEGGGKAHE